MISGMAKIDDSTGAVAAASVRELPGDDAHDDAERPGDDDGRDDLAHGGREGREKHAAVGRGRRDDRARRRQDDLADQAGAHHGFPRGERDRGDEQDLGGT